VREFARERGVWLRAFGRWMYTMPAYITSENDLQKITNVMKAWFSSGLADQR
jgi:adenosylmethionine-8-amino-7-oxononanoate aminotransferase